MGKEKGRALWEKDGDGDRMRLFFQREELDEETRERIKRLTERKLESLQQKEALGLAPFPAEQSGLKQGLKALLLSVWWRWRWKPVLLTMAGCLLAVTVYLGSGAPMSDAGYSGTQAVSEISAKGADTPSGSVAHTSPSAMPEGGGEGAVSSLAVSGDGSGNSRGLSVADSDAVFDVKQGFTAAVGDESDQAYSRMYSEEYAEQETVGGRKVILNLEATVTVADVGAVVQAVSEQALTLGGYIVHVSQVNGEASARAEVTIRIPAERLAVMQEQLAVWGTVQSQTLSGEDVTDAYLDAQTRLRHWQAEEAHYLEILGQAQNVEEMLKVEESLANVRLQTEQLQGRLKLWNEQIEFSTVSLTLVPQKPAIGLMDHSWQPLSLLNTLKVARLAILKTASTLWNAVNYLIIGIGYLLLPALLAGLIGGGCYWRRKKKRKESVE